MSTKCFTQKTCNILENVTISILPQLVTQNKSSHFPAKTFLMHQQTENTIFTMDYSHHTFIHEIIPRSISYISTFGHFLSIKQLFDITLRCTIQFRFCFINCINEPYEPSSFILLRKNSKHKKQRNQTLRHDLLTYLDHGFMRVETEKKLCIGIF